MLKEPHALEEVIINELNHQLNGWIEKVKDFEVANFSKELSDLKSDTLYPIFNLDTPQYATIRLMGRVSISIGRRLGELYDKIPRLLAMHRYNLTKEQVAPKYNGLEVDVCLTSKSIDSQSFSFINDVYFEYFERNIDTFGLGIEIRYNFNPNDSSRLRKDCVMASEMVRENLTPIYLVYSSISPRNEAIERLKRAGWHFLIGQDALDFSSKILGLDVSTIWKREKIKRVINSKVDEMMLKIKNSHAISEFLK